MGIITKRLLVTTALEQSWPDHGPVLFLGEWCRRYSRKDRWEAMDAEVLPYHWDDRDKLCADYQYLQDFYERLLADLTVHLNQIHNVDHSLRYWRILIGPWLGYFVQMVFDRWASIQQAIVHDEISETIVLVDKEESLIPSDMNDFLKLVVEDDWNHHIYAYILQHYTKVKCIKQLISRESFNTKINPVRRNFKQKIKRNLENLYSICASKLVRKHDAFIQLTYLPYLDELKLQWRLGQVPQVWHKVFLTPVAVDDKQRQWTVIEKNHSEFESFVCSIIPLQIPTVYLEGYHQLGRKTSVLAWPKQPKLIWTSNVHIAEDVFKAWAAQKVEQGSTLVIGQCGGTYGVSKWLFVETHEMMISDYYLSWGWLDACESKSKAKIIPVGQLKSKRPLGVQHAKQPRALLVTALPPRYSYSMSSTMISRQWLDYFNDQCDFVRYLTPVIRSALIVRLYVHDYGWDHEQRWRDCHPDIQLDGGKSNIYDLVRRSRLYISTYNATTYLEAFTMDVPTVIYWNENHNELRDSAVPYFEDLKRVGIFHGTPESAARHVTVIWEDVDAWWRSTEVREVLERFKSHYCNLPDNLLERVESTLSEVVSERNYKMKPSLTH